MIFLIILFYLAPATLTSTIPPISSLLSSGFNENSIYPHSDPPLPLAILHADVSTCTCPSQQRSIRDIIWMCLTVIFACSWASVHPNIPAPEEKWWRSCLQRLEYMLWTIVSPELIIWWACMQWRGAQRIQREQKDRGWTVTHGHFMQMGGFMLFEGKERRKALSYDCFCALLDQGRISFPNITQQEIKDKSKSNGLSKALLVGQTGWFIIQCITRGAQGLPITELELSTLGFAMLNGIMYFFWWNKPFDVQCPFPIYLIPTNSEVSMRVPEPTSDDEIMDPEDRMFEFTSNNAINTEVSIPESALNDGTVSPDSKLEAKFHSEDGDSDNQFFSRFISAFDSVPPLLRNAVSWSSWKEVIIEPMNFFDRRRSITWPLPFIYFMKNLIFKLLTIVMIILYICIIILSIFVILFPTTCASLLISYIGGRMKAIYMDQNKDNSMQLVNNDDNPRYDSTPGPMRMPPFYSKPPQAQGSSLHIHNFNLSFLLIPLIGTLYGGIHCAAWAFQFPTVAELWLWRISSIIIAAGPIVIALFILTLPLTSSNSSPEILSLMGVSIISFQVLAYVLAKIIIMTITISTLRDLPPGAFNVVQWTSFLPHI